MKIWKFALFLILPLACGEPSEKKDLSYKVDSLEQEIEELKAANDTLSDYVMQKAFVTKSYPAYFDSISQPEEHILQNLQKNPRLIPKDPVLGGTMHFTSVSFINDDLLLAEYEDGHVLGKAIYTYSIDRLGNLQFELVSAIR